MTEPADDGFKRLAEVMRTLRAPGGCPWDREQTLQSLKPFVLEETYEVPEAIDGGYPAELCEELGDFLYEAVFLAQIAEEQGDSTIDDAAQAIVDKLVRRHPHVFARAEGDEGISSAQVIEKWATLKAKERAARGDSAKPKTALSGVPKALPALLRAYEVSSRAATVGFDWEHATHVLDKIEEEVAELREAVEAGHDSREHAVEEMGDLLFALANLARKLGIEPEDALRRANDKFTRRFEVMARAIEADGTRFEELTLEQMEAYWQRIKGAYEEHDHERTRNTRKDTKEVK